MSELSKNEEIAHLKKQLRHATIARAYFESENDLSDEYIKQIESDYDKMLFERDSLRELIEEIQSRAETVECENLHSWIPLQLNKIKKV